MDYHHEAGQEEDLVVLGHVAGVRYVCGCEDHAAYAVVH